MFRYGFCTAIIQKWERHLLKRSEIVFFFQCCVRWQQIAFCDEQDSPLLKMELMVPKEVMAKDLADRFRKNTEQLYASVINALFEAPREKKE